MLHDCCGGAPVHAFPTGVSTLWPCTNVIGTTSPIEGVQTPEMIYDGITDASNIIDGEISWSPEDDPATVRLVEIKPQRMFATLEYPIQCYEIMQANCEERLDISKPRHWLYHAEMLRRSYDEPETMGEYLQTYVDCVLRSWVQPNDDTLFPGTLIGYTPDFNIVYISGTSTFQQRAFQGALSEIGPVDVDPYSSHPMWLEAAAAIAERIIATGMPIKNKWFFAGHSYGAAVASILAADMSAAFPERDITLFTIGSPCPGDGRLRRLLEPLKQAHLQNFGDPVCSMPPNSLTFNLLSSLLSDELRAAWPKWEPHNRRFALFADGSYAAINEGAVEFGTLVTLTQAITAAIGLPNYDVHAASVYRDRCLNVIG